LLVAVLGIAGDTDRADYNAAFIADLHSAAFRKQLAAARADQVVDEGRLLLGANANEPGGAPERQRGISLPERHLEADHRGAVLLLERLHLAARLDHDHAQRSAIKFRPALEDGG